ncbi:MULTISPECIES: hypothetical protein [Halorussus]|uniref:DUF7344 domain-containing protein n=1 Tax=Halorussus TaxID=1070314 RepID=UPI000E20DC61|nr:MULTISPECIES: hypothetical protein [Halorussus]NHN59331.1 hypothetical protein [Halorussus sp. JP-T4]
MTRESPSETDRQSAEADVSDPSLEDALGALADDRRRAALRYLVARDGDGPVDVGELAEAVAGEDDVDDARRSLHHAHLPQLDEAGIAVYDAREGRVRLAGEQRTVEAFLDAAGEAPE